MELNVLNKTGGKETLLNESNYVFKWKKKLKKLKLFLVITLFVVIGHCCSKTLYCGRNQVIMLLLLRTEIFILPIGDID